MTPPNIDLHDAELDHREAAATCDAGRPAADSAPQGRAMAAPRAARAAAERSGFGQRKTLVPVPQPGPLVDADELLLSRKQVTRRVGDQALSSGAGVASAVVKGAALGAVSLAVIGQRAAAGAANVSVVRADQSASAKCQPDVDLKAFTGKGEARPLLPAGKGLPRTVRLAIAELDRVHQAMKALAQSTLGVARGQLYLVAHVRSSTGQQSLRWRGRRVVNGVTRTAHLSWEEAAARIESLPYATKVAMEQWNDQAIELNAGEKTARAELSRLQRIELKKKALAQA